MMASRRAISQISSRLGAIRTYATTSASTPGAAPTSLTLNFAVPHAAIHKDMTIFQANVPAISGDMGILAAHVPIVDQLKPGVVEIVPSAGAKGEKYFVSGGFVTVTPDSVVNISAVEAAPLGDFDLDAAKQHLDESSRSDGAVNKIETEIYQALVTALTTQSK